ncbi:MAG: hypothetical protein ABIP51_15725, partial [Bacteroidia bacterium]
MKKINLGLLILIMVLNSCKKEEKTMSPITTNSAPAEGASKQPTALTLQELLQFPEDMESQNFTMQQLRLGYGLLKVLKTTTAKSEIVTYAQQSNDRGINLDQYLAAKPGKLATINAELANVPAGIGTGNSYAEIRNYLTYNTVPYKFTLKVTNCSTAVTNLGFYLAIGQEIKTDDDLLANHIPAWYYSADGTTSIVLLSDYDLTHESEPIIIISEINTSAFTNNHVQSSTIPLIYNFSTSGNNPPPVVLATAELYHTSASINYRYERDHKSEYTITSYFTAWP